MPLENQLELGTSNFTAPWTLVTSHGLVLLYLSVYPDSTMREVAKSLGLTERRVIDVIRDLKATGHLSVKHDGRRNSYSLSADACFRHPFVADVNFGDFLALWRDSQTRDATEIEP
jgi:hypothetical protein